MPVACLQVCWVPGSFELPVVAKAMAKSGKFDAVICIGVVVRGATTHYEAVCSAATSGVLNVGVDTGGLNEWSAFITRLPAQEYLVVNEVAKWYTLYLAVNVCIAGTGSACVRFLSPSHWLGTNRSLRIPCTAHNINAQGS